MPDRGITIRHLQRQPARGRSASATCGSTCPPGADHEHRLGADLQQRDRRDCARPRSQIGETHAHGLHRAGRRSRSGRSPSTTWTRPPGGSPSSRSRLTLPTPPAADPDPRRGALGLGLRHLLRAQQHPARPGGANPIILGTNADVLRQSRRTTSLGGTTAPFVRLPTYCGPPYTTKVTAEAWNGTGRHGDRHDADRRHRLRPGAVQPDADHRRPSTTQRDSPTGADVTREPARRARPGRDRPVARQGHLGHAPRGHDDQPVGRQRPAGLHGRAVRQGHARRRSPAPTAAKVGTAKIVSAAVPQPLTGNGLARASRSRGTRTACSCRRPGAGRGHAPDRVGEGRPADGPPDHDVRGHAADAVHRVHDQHDGRAARRVRDAAGLRAGPEHERPDAVERPGERDAVGDDRGVRRQRCGRRRATARRSRPASAPRRASTPGGGGHRRSPPASRGRTASSSSAGLTVTQPHGLARPDPAGAAVLRRSDAAAGHLRRAPPGSGRPRCWPAPAATRIRCPAPCTSPARTTGRRSGSRSSSARSPGPTTSGPSSCAPGSAIDPLTAAITVDGDALPTILQGIPLRLREVKVTVDKQGFLFNGTDVRPAVRLRRVHVDGRARPARPRRPCPVTGCDKLVVHADDLRDHRRAADAEERREPVRDRHASRPAR